MLDSIRNLKTCQIDLRERLDGLERDWLIGRLVSKRSVLDAVYSDEDSHRLIIEYDADLVNGTDLLEFLYMCGLHAQPAPARLAFGVYQPRLRT